MKHEYNDDILYFIICVIGIKGVCIMLEGDTVLQLLPTYLNISWRMLILKRTSFQLNFFHFICVSLNGMRKEMFDCVDDEKYIPPWIKSVPSD